MALALKKKVLIVDNHPIARNFLSLCAEDLGFHVETAADGAEALLKAKSFVPDIMTLNMVMPKQSGYKTLKNIRALEGFEKLPIIAVTAHSNDEGHENEDKRKIYANFSGPKASRIILEKPITPKKLARRMAEILNVEIETEHHDNAPSQHMKVAEVASLLTGATPETLAKVHRLLHEEKTK